MPNKAWWIAGAGVALATAALVWMGGGQEAANAAPAPPAPARVTGAPFFSDVAQVQGLPLPSERDTRLRELQQHFAEVDRTLCDYRAGTRYPQQSRPMAEHPDQVYPNLPVAESKPMRTQDGKTDASVQIQSSQSRVFMVAGEAVAFSVRAVDKGGQPLDLVITRAAAAGMAYQNKRSTPQVPLLFADDGKLADAVAGDGAHGAVLAPAQTGLASFNGTIRAEVRYSVKGRAGVLIFDVIYSPEVPATWSGQIRETEENGSLVYYLKADVRQAGRYVVTGRVDDAKGKPFALATFNEVLPTGPNEIKLLVFGKLLRDQAPTLPLTLRDVDGYLLKENADPDRLLMPRMEGKAFTGKPHPLKSFSDEEWKSEERNRYLEEFGKDVARAKAALNRFDPALPAPAGACDQVGEGKIAP